MKKVTYSLWRTFTNFPWYFIDFLIVFLEFPFSHALSSLSVQQWTIGVKPLLFVLLFLFLGGNLKKALAQKQCVTVGFGFWGFHRKGKKGTTCKTKGIRDEKEGAGSHRLIRVGYFGFSGRAGSGRVDVEQEEN